MRTWFEQQWQQLGWAQCLLLPLSWVFLALTACRKRLYQCGVFSSTRLAVPVIVVGNISVGGVGKTPVVLWLAEQLLLAGYQPGILSRGYGGKHHGEVSACSAPVLFGDEPVLLAQRSGCPVWVHAKRVLAGQALLDAYPACDVLICDDGLQHYALQRTIEIAVVHRPRGLGNHRLLPAGPLREPLQRLASVDLIIESGDLPDSAHTLPSFQLQLHSAHWLAVSDSSRHATVDILRGESLIVVAGIGHPQRFFDTLKQQGLQFESRVFADHHMYTPQDFAETGKKTILMTEKDAVKCRHLGLENAWYLPVDAELKPIGHTKSLMFCVLGLLEQRNGVRI
ncbi:tetraacyldisaccharide 4'-kinase [Methylophilus aquaticus]|uniref:Tetraacyldisaccharide 4'-kinase n=1 Tax=Methylophilus aquaticus TaxID=1971610 RepID=A0ABT9JQI0_9PROT|nr:tetraacyldisaccharide 4'-kinase [Methylophilus aquaticus]MDP8566822.1 tetraacyldisaccharide 4'-kinase [Methylophilus aquaticus]